MSADEKKNRPQVHKVTKTGQPDYSPSLTVTWYGSFLWAEDVYYGTFASDYRMPRYSDTNIGGLPLRYGPVTPPDNHYHDYYGGHQIPWEDEDRCYATYGDPGRPDLPGYVAPPTPDIPNTSYHRYGDSHCFVYGHPTDSRPSPIEILPEDARAIIAELSPIRVNHCHNPNFVDPINQGPSSWWSSGTVHPVNGVDAPFGDTALLMWPNSMIEYGTFGDYRDAIYVGTTDVDGMGGQDATAEGAEHNYWRIGFTTNARAGVYCGFKVLHRDGSITTEDFSHIKPMARPWETTRENPTIDELGVSIQLDPDPRTNAPPILNPVPGALDTPQISKADSSPGPDPNISPYSTTGWYFYYDVLDLGPDALWALPYIGVGSWAWSPSEDPDNPHHAGMHNGTAVITSTIVEKWDTKNLVKTGPTQHVENPANMRYDLGTGWSDYHDFLMWDPLIFFAGDSNNDSPYSDFVWMGEPQQSATGYYPQRHTRVQALKKLAKSWTPLGRPLSVRYVYERT